MCFLVVGMTWRGVLELLLCALVVEGCVCVPPKNHVVLGALEDEEKD